MFRAVVFLAGPSRFSDAEKQKSWNCWVPVGAGVAETAGQPTHVYIADAGLESFLSWFDSLDAQNQSELRSVLWCGDGDSLGEKGRERLSHAAARFEGRWREHVYDSDKDFSDCAAITSLIEYDLRHESTPAGAWIEVHGALEGRLDHELVNVFEFAASLTRIPQPSAYLLGPATAVATCALTGHLKKGDVFTVLSSNPQCVNTLAFANAKYSGNIDLRQPSHGLSNVSLGDQITIQPVKLACPFLAIQNPRKQIKKS
jgi:thiamine pyrophosphokinase